MNELLILVSALALIGWICFIVTRSEIKKLRIEIPLSPPIERLRLLLDDAKQWKHTLYCIKHSSGLELWTESGREYLKLYRGSDGTGKVDFSTREQNILWPLVQQCLLEMEPKPKEPSRAAMLNKAIPQ